MTATRPKQSLGVGGLNRQWPGMNAGVQPAPLAKESRPMKQFILAAMCSATMCSCASMTGAEFMEAKVTQLTFADGARNTQPFVSPDGRQIAFLSNRTGAWEVWVMRADGSHQRQLTDYLGLAGWPSWTPDGESVLYYNRKEDRFTFFTADWQTGTIAEFPFPPYNAGHNYCPLLSPDGRKLLFDRHSSSGPPNHDLFAYDIETGNLRQLTDDADHDSDGRWSPDGKHIAYTAQPGADQHQRNGRDIWIMNADGTESTRVTTHVGFDSDPAWTHDGTALIFTTDRYGGEELAHIAVQGATQ